MTTTTQQFQNREASQQSRWAAFQTTMRNALIITEREVRDSFRDWRILGPIILLTFLFPFLAQFVASEFSNWLEGFGAELIGERTIPFLLMVVGFFPISISLVIALETFVGEKERRSLEPLLSTPLSNTELYIGKTLAAMIPPLVSSYGGMFVYMSSLLAGELAWRPPAMLIAQIILLTTVQALVMVSGAVVVSSQTTSTRAANLLASFIIIPMTLVVQGESVIMFVAPDATSNRGIGALWAIIFGMFVVAVLLLRVGNSIFNREELLGSTIDRLNIRGLIGRIWGNIRAVDAAGTPARNILDWYRRGLPYSLSQVRRASRITIGVFLVAFILGAILAQTPQWHIDLPDQSEFVDGSSQIKAFLTPELHQTAFSFILWQNARVLLGTALLSVFTFGVAALVIPPMTFAILGYITSLVFSAGYDPLFLVAAVFTHGIVEIPTILLAASTALALGAIVTRPPKNTTVGQAWMQMVAHAIKLTIGLILPGLIVAALIEAYVTPHVVVAVLGG